MAQKAGVKAIDPKDVSVFYGRSPELISSLKGVKNKQNFETLMKTLDVYCEKFENVFVNKYCDSVYVTRDKKAQKASLKELQELDEKLVEQLLSTEEGYRVLAVAEEYGAKIDWNKMPLTAIDSKECMAFLAKRGYDFNAKRMVDGIETDFAEYNLTGLGYFERETVKVYDELSERSQKFEKLRSEVRARYEEFNSPKTSSERKAEIDQYFDSVAESYVKENNNLGELCKDVSFFMNNYYRYAACLEGAIENKYISPANIEKIKPENLNLSIEYMNGRHQMLERYERVYRDNRSSDAREADTAKEKIAMLDEFSKEKTLSGTLASAENGKAVYAKEAQVEKLGMSMTERLAQQTQGSTLESAENAMAFVGKDSQTNA